MKNKAVFLIAIAAITTLSFSFVSGNQTVPEIDQPKVETSGPIGGFVIEDSL